VIPTRLPDHCATRVRGARLKKALKTHICRRCAGLSVRRGEAAPNKKSPPSFVLNGSGAKRITPLKMKKNKKENKNTENH
jgi:hypothetical protein